MTSTAFHPLQRSLMLTIITLALAACEPAVSPSGEATGTADDDYERGPHNGRLLRDGDFALEVTIFESGVPPEFRVYPFRNDAPLEPAAVDLVIELGRLGDRKDRFEFAPQGDYLRGDGIVLEPHSFDVTVTAESGGLDYRWYYESYEGRTSIDPTIASSMGIEVEIAGPAIIRETLVVQGVIAPDPDRVFEARGRFPGQVQSLEKSVGDPVRRGEELARVLSNESLQSYTVTAPDAGTVIERPASVGGLAAEEPIYVIADTSRVVADLQVFPRDLDRVAVGQPVAISPPDGGHLVESTVLQILPTLDASSRTATARVAIDSADSSFRPGQFVEGTVTLANVDVPLAVRESALQSFRDFTVVYARVGDTYEVRMLDLGRRDGDYVEVLGGLEPGTTYVTGNSFLIKADIEKSGASHDH